MGSTEIACNPRTVSLCAQPDDYRCCHIFGCRVLDALVVAFGYVDGHFFIRERFTSRSMRRKGLNAGLVTIISGKRPMTPTDSKYPALERRLSGMESNFLFSATLWIFELVFTQVRGS